MTGLIPHNQYILEFMNERSPYFLSAIIAHADFLVEMSEFSNEDNFLSFLHIWSLVFKE